MQLRVKVFPDTGFQSLMTSFSVPLDYETSRGVTAWAMSCRVSHVPSQLGPSKIDVAINMQAEQDELYGLLSTINFKVDEFLCSLQAVLRGETACGTRAALTAFCGQLKQFFELLGGSMFSHTEHLNIQTDLKRLVCWLDKISRHVPPTAPIHISNVDSAEIFNLIQELHPLRVGLQRHVADHIAGFLLDQKRYGDKVLENIFSGQACSETYLGGGAFGSTYRLENVPLGCVFAVKQIDLTRPIPQHFLSPEALQRECSILESLKHPNIARYYTSYYSDEETGTGKYRFFNVVMELVEAGTLAEKVTTGSGAPSEEEVVEWAQQMASALSYMHSMHIYHRDLKPDNVMLTSGSAIKIIDLGLACQNNSSASLKLTLIGSPLYASYEKTTGAPYDGRDDVWAMGLMFLELLIGERLGTLLDRAKL
jgi:hypothetical protein